MCICREDGKMKIRPVDHFSWSNVATRSRKRIKLNSVNGMTEVPEAIKHDHLDDLVASMTLLRRFVLLMFLSPHPPIIRICLCCCVRLTGETPALWKLDVDSAFRRIPLDVNHIWAAAVAFKYKGIPYVSTHHATPFGATSSVWSWERVGAAITHMARVILKIPAHRYVDDLFGADRFVSCLLSLCMCKYAAQYYFCMCQERVCRARHEVCKKACGSIARSGCGCR